MAVTLTQVAEALKARLDTINDLYVELSPPAVRNLPCAVIIPPPINYAVGMGQRVIELDFQVQVFVGLSAGHEQAETLWPFLDWDGTRSILQALRADRTLGVPGVDSALLAGQPLDMETPEELSAFGYALTLKVVVTN